MSKSKKRYSSESSSPKRKSKSRKNYRRKSKSKAKRRSKSKSRKVYRRKRSPARRSPYLRYYAYPASGMGMSGMGMSGMGMSGMGMSGMSGGVDYLNKHKPLNEINKPKCASALFKSLDNQNKMNEYLAASQFYKDCDEPAFYGFRNRFIPEMNSDCLADASQKLGFIDDYCKNKPDYSKYVAPNPLYNPLWKIINDAKKTRDAKTDYKTWLSDPKVKSWKDNNKFFKDIYDDVNVDDWDKFFKAYSDRKPQRFDLSWAKRS